MIYVKLSLLSQYRIFKLVFRDFVSHSYSCFGLLTQLKISCILAPHSENSKELPYFSFRFSVAYYAVRMKLQSNCPRYTPPPQYYIVQSTEITKQYQNIDLFSSKNIFKRASISKIWGQNFWPQNLCKNPMWTLHHDQNRSTYNQL